MTKADDFLAKLTDLYGKYGGKAYGKSPVTNLQHSLQAALLAQNEDGRREMVVAALLHDVGHLVEPEEEYEKEHPDEDFAHETLAVGLLGAFLPPAVVEPIRLHVDAKRYLVAVDKSYYDILSGVSHVTLKLQGGPFNAEQVAEFERNPFWRDAVQLRKWDDRAKTEGLVTPSLADYMPLIRECLIAQE